MRMTSELATLAEAEEDIDDEDDSEEDPADSDTCTFDVPHFPYIDDDDVGEEESENSWGDGRGCAPEDCCNPSSFRYVVVSGTPLKILEHLLSDLRLDDQRGAPENRESGESQHPHKNTRELKSLYVETRLFHCRVNAKIIRQRQVQSVKIKPKSCNEGVICFQVGVPVV